MKGLFVRGWGGGDEGIEEIRKKACFNNVLNKSKVITKGFAYCELFWFGYFCVYFFSVLCGLHFHFSHFTTTNFLFSVPFFSTCLVHQNPSTELYLIINRS